MNVTVVGAGARFHSGITRYTVEVANAFERAGHTTTAILARRMLPKRLYPGRDRVGRAGTDQLGLNPGVRVTEGLDWYAGPGTLRAYAEAVARPGLIVLQWWTATMLHHHLAVATLGRLRGSRIVLEVHETIDPSERSIPGVGAYVRVGMRLLDRLCHAVVIHSEAEAERVRHELGLRRPEVTVILHGPYPLPEPQARREDAGEGLRIAHIGVVRAYKGVETLTEAVSLLRGRGVDAHLAVAGEGWEPEAEKGCSSLGQACTRIDRHLTEQEIADLIETSDVIALPYVRSSASGPLALAMAAGRPVAVSDLPTLREAADGYTGAAWAAPGDADALAKAILDAAGRAGERHRDARSWDENVGRYLAAGGVR